MTSGQEGPPEETHQDLAEQAASWQSEQPRLSVVPGGLDEPVDARPRLKVLAVEDDQEDFAITADLMARAEDTVFDVFWANDAEVALRHLAENSFDACLVDLRLPGLDGLGFADRIRTAGFTLPIILTSGAPEPETAFEAVERGFDDYVDKEELEVGQLERRIRFAVARRRHVRAHRTATHFKEPAASSGDLSALSAMLREALAANTLQLRFRPQEPLEDSDRVLAAELSLSGGRHDRLSTHHLVQLAGDRELADALGNWVIETAVRDLSLWSQAGAGGVALALPAAAISDDGTAIDGLIDAIERFGIAAGRLELEIDEAQLVEATVPTWRLVDAIIERGVRIAIAGFGRSIASLSMLRDVAFDTVKLAPEFVIGRANDEQSNIIPTDTVALCRRLGKRVVAENMAGFSNLDQLSRAGVSAVQIPTSITSQNAIAWATAPSDRDPCWQMKKRESISST